MKGLKFIGLIMLCLIVGALMYPLVAEIVGQING